MITHTEMCIKAQAEDAAYQAQWPNHCTCCHGEGQVSYDEDPSAGVGVGSLSPGSYTFVDPCEECIEKNICPRCGKLNESWVIGEIFEHIQCEYCAWKAGDPGRPDYDCCCHDIWFNEQADQAERDYYWAVNRGEV